MHASDVWVLLLLCSVVCGRIYVAHGGIDGDECGGYSSPCATLEKAVALGCQSTMGEVIMVEPGEYQSPTSSIYCPLTLRYDPHSSQRTISHIPPDLRREPLRHFFVKAMKKPG